LLDIQGDIEILEYIDDIAGIAHIANIAVRGDIGAV
jgi:hypothetical protein